MSKQILVPDVGEADEVSVIEILVDVGDVVSVDDSLVVLESEKASMEIPSPFAGRVSSITIKEGDEVEEGDLLLEMEAESETDTDTVKETATEIEETAETEEIERTGEDESTESEQVIPSVRSDVDTPPAPEAPVAGAAGETSEQIIVVPDVGEATDIVVTEILVSVGDTLAVEDSILVLESEKASMEIPTPMAGEVQAVLVAEGAEVDEGDELIRLLVSGPSDQAVPRSAGAESVETAPAKSSEVPESEAASAKPVPASKGVLSDTGYEDDTAAVYAGPAVSSS